MTGGRGVRIVAVAAALGMFGGCAADPPGRDEFVEHALEISTTIKGEADREKWRGWFGCAYDEMEDSPDVLRDVAAADTLNQLSEDSEAAFNAAIQVCLAGDRSPTVDPGPG